jgi:hypothetical protein
MARFTLVVAYSKGKRSCSNHERTNEGDDPPVVEVGEDRSCAQPSIRQALQREQD